jgi:nicotinate-nucleotide adenylyltransferase
MTGVTGLLGGTFDPIHHGHLRLALECAAAAGCDETRLVPAHLPPHRAAPVAGAAQRLRMAQLAAGGGDGLSVDDREIRRGGVSFTVETLEDLRRTHDGPLCLFLGDDAFRQLHTWHRWRELTALAHLVVAGRPGGGGATPPTPEIADLEREHGIADAGALGRRAAGAILRVDIPALDISSTRIRALLAAGRSVRYLVPDAVIHFIQEEALYRKPA